MNKPARLALVLSTATVLTVFLGLTGMATEEEPPPTETTAVTTDIEPVVVVTAPPADTSTADWTYRYLVPTGIALVVLVIIATTIRYFTNVVRKRYRIVEE